MNELIVIALYITLYSVIIIGVLSILYLALRAFQELLTLIFKQIRVFNAVVEYFWHREQFREFLKSKIQ
jgi:hypothetical protein